MRRFPRRSVRPLIALAALAAVFGIVTLIARPETELERPVASPPSVSPPPAQLRTTDVLVLNETKIAGLAGVTSDELRAALGIDVMVDTGPVRGRKQTVVQAVSAADITLARSVADALHARFDAGPLQHAVEPPIEDRALRVVVFVGSDRMR